MDSTVSYINDRGEYKIAIIPEEIKDEVVQFGEEDSAYTYTNPISNKSYFLHSIADRPCLTEGPDNRNHWMWRGQLHRTSGPAFYCDQNPGEWYFCGIPLLKEDFNKYHDYFVKVEKYAVEQGIDLHGIRDEANGSDYFLHFMDDQHLLVCAEDEVIPICNRRNGTTDTVSLSDLIVETSTKKSSGISLLAAFLGVAATAVAVNKLKPKLKEEKAKVDNEARKK